MSEGDNGTTTKDGHGILGSKEDLVDDEEAVDGEDDSVNDDKDDSGDGDDDYLKSSVTAHDQKYTRCTLCTLSEL
jgi:hypothetical protein